MSDQQTPCNLEDIAELEDGYFVSKKFRSSDADVVFQSIDSVRFYVYTKDLATFSGGFPPPELVLPSREFVHLPETAAVLDLLFSFARPQRYPDLYGLPIGLLVALTHAAEKYEVYAAVNACRISMRNIVSTNPREVFVYAAQFDYVELLDESAPVVLGTSLVDLVDLVPARCFKAWIRYVDALNPVRESLLKSLLHMVREDCRDDICPEQQDLMIQRLARQMLNKEVLLQLSSKLCPSCSSDTPVSDLFEIRRTKWSFTPSAIEGLYGGFPKFSTFL